MKIAVATNDKINIAECIRTANCYKVFTLDSNVIVKEEFRDNYKSEEFNKVISDCSLLIVNNKVIDCNIPTVITSEKLITNAIVKCVNDKFSKECNTCCQP